VVLSFFSTQGFGAKTRELDEHSSGEVIRWRERFAELQNKRFRENGIDANVDHRSLEAQGIAREPTRHLGVVATGYERRTGQASRKRLDFEKEVAERLAKAKELGEMEREAQALECTIIDLSGNLATAKAERDRQQALIRQNPWQPQDNTPTPTQQPKKASIRQEDTQAKPESLGLRLVGGTEFQGRRAGSSRSVLEAVKNIGNKGVNLAVAAFSWVNR
jgi:MobA/MobL family